jgi:hypothetical protein
LPKISFARARGPAVSSAVIINRRKKQLTCTERFGLDAESDINT